jgi:hypothetical protein
MTLRVVGAGFGRTGTTSLKAALEKLGFQKCHHMQEVGPQIGAWQDLADGKSVDWDEVFEGFQASCDWPSCTYWEELSHHYPEAKVLLTVRDEGRWYDSVAETIYPASFFVPEWLARRIPVYKRYHKMVIDQVWDGVFEGRFEDRDHALSVYRAHNARVKERCDPSRLLVFEVKDGWAPLCKFLEVPVPDEPFPHLNDAKMIRGALLAARILGWGLLAAAVLGVAALVL